MDRENKDPNVKQRSQQRSQKKRALLESIEKQPKEEAKESRRVRTCILRDKKKNVCQNMPTTP